MLHHGDAQGNKLPNIPQPHQSASHSAESKANGGGGGTVLNFCHYQPVLERILLHIATHFLQTRSIRSADESWTLWPERAPFQSTSSTSKLRILGSQRPMSRSSDTTVPCNPLKPGNLVRPHSNDERGSGTDSADLSLQVIILRRVPSISTLAPGANVSFSI